MFRKLRALKLTFESKQKNIHFLSSFFILNQSLIADQRSLVKIMSMNSMNYICYLFPHEIVKISNYEQIWCEKILEHHWNTVGQWWFVLSS
jgi:hypothetical protein